MKSAAIFTFFFLLLSLTRAAPSNLSLRLSPTSLKFAIVFQQILTEHDPLTPWHLHKSFILLLIACNKWIFTMCHYQLQWIDPTNFKFMYDSQEKLPRELHRINYIKNPVLNSHKNPVLNSHRIHWIRWRIIFSVSIISYMICVIWLQIFI